MEKIDKGISTWEALKCLQEGSKVRRKSWKAGDYIKLNKIGRIFDKNDHQCPIQFSRLYYDWEVIQ